MKELIEWQIHIEKMLGDFYGSAANTFREDEKFSGFLMHLAEDELEHFCVMRDAGKYGKEEKDYPPILTVDKTTKEEIEGSLIEKRKIMSKAKLSKEQLIDFIVTMEFSGFNATFLYIVSSFKESKPKFIQLAEKIQKHEESIEEFVESLPYGAKYLSRILKLQKGGQKKLLLVDDSRPIIQTLSLVFSKDFIIETAENGEEGLKKANEQYFDVIISDIDMPVLNGMDFYNEAAKRDPGIGERFLFFTGMMNPKRSAFFSANNLRSIEKPVSIKEIKQKVIEIVHN